MAKTKTAGANLPVPQDRDEAAASVTTIGEVKRNLARLEADMNDALARIKLEFETQAAPLTLAVEQRIQGLAIWAEANRTKLTGGDKTKTVDLGTGVLRWRNRPPSVRLTKVEQVIERLKTMKLTRFLRVKTEIDKEAMLKEPALARTVPGVGIGTEGEDFIVEPYEAELSAQA